MKGRAVLAASCSARQTTPLLPYMQYMLISFDENNNNNKKICILRICARVHESVSSI